MKNLFAAFSTTLLLILVSGTVLAGNPDDHAPATLMLNANKYRIEVEIADTLKSRTIGLMNRHSLPFNRGMLFIFPEAQVQCMWMKNTHIPLSAVFLDSDGTIVNIADMEPGTTKIYCSAKPIRHVLEVNRGWIREMGLDTGTRITGLGKAPSGH